MFTGLIEELGEIVRTTETPEGRRIAVRALQVREGLRTGDSVAINGACQTVTALPGSGVFEVLAVGETLRRTTLGSLRPGAKVNLERPLRVGDRLGGHWVNGHVDTTATVEEVLRSGDDLSVRIALPPAIARYAVEKGSIAVDGVSLTVGEVDAEAFHVHIIPETWHRTLFGSYRVGTVVNLEADILAKYVERALGAAPAGGRLDGTRGSDNRSGAAGGPRDPSGWSSDAARRIVESWGEESGDGTAS